MEDLNRKLDAIMSKLDQFDSMNEKIDQLTESVKFINSKYEEIKNNIKVTIDNQEILNKGITKLQKEGKEQKLKIHSLTERLEYLERTQLDSTMNLYPLLETENENILDVVKLIGACIGQKLDSDNVISAFRRSKRKSGNPGEVVVKLASHELRDRVLELIKNKKLMHGDIGLNCKLGRIYCNEELTAEGKNIYYAALKLRKDKGYRFIWTKGGRTYIKRKEGENTIRLDNMNILDKLL